MVIARWYTNRKRAHWSLQQHVTSERIAQLTEALEGIEEDLWPEEHQELLESRTRLAWKRSDLLMKLGGFAS